MEVSVMVMFVVLSCWTDRGFQHVKESPARIESFKKQVRSFGGEVREVYVTLGRYDTLSLVSAFDDEVMAKIAIGLGVLGNVHTEILRFFSESEFKKMVSALP